MNHLLQNIRQGSVYILLSRKLEMNTSGLILFLTFIIGSQACPACPKKIEVKDSKDCKACTECNYPEDGTKRSMDMWCKNPVCGEYHKSTKPFLKSTSDSTGVSGRTCPITYHGLCGLTKCAKGVRKSNTPILHIFVVFS